MSHVLVVDDSNYARRVMRKTLEQAGYRVSEAGSGMSALEAFFLEKPSIILLDLTMDDMGGMEVLEQLRAAESTVPVIVISADVQDSTSKIVEDAGAQHFLGKPVATPVLLKAIEDALAGANR
jgi:two-component system chemotaxis response regulator CheY